MGITVKFHHIAGAAEPQGGGGDSQVPKNQQISPAFILVGVVAALVEQLSLGSLVVFQPKVFQMNQGPLPGTEGKVLDAG